MILPVEAHAREEERVAALAGLCWEVVDERAGGQGGGIAHVTRAVLEAPGQGGGQASTVLLAQAALYRPPPA